MAYLGRHHQPWSDSKRCVWNNSYLNTCRPFPQAASTLQFPSPLKPCRLNPEYFPPMNISKLTQKAKLFYFWSCFKAFLLSQKLSSRTSFLLPHFHCLFFHIAAPLSSSLHSAEPWSLNPGLPWGGAAPPATLPPAGLTWASLPVCLSPRPPQSSSSSPPSSSELGPSSSEELGSGVLASEIMPSELSISMDVSDR